ncbi:hypothetical protein H2203_004435 [Taxawa tesnikishii (nom. ined.)]|nr:hypothetical protein H2203_004435 [Dothideales sp. JES 119]
MKAPESPLAVRILTHNIRFANTSPGPSEKPWLDRCPGLLSELKYHTRYLPTAFICLQEVLHEQLQDLLGGLNVADEEWASIGVGRDDGKNAGEYAPILYRPSVWKLEHFKTFWLSETPDRPSKGWDASSTRLVTLGVFQHNETRSRVVAMNTHLDDQGVVARQEAAKLIIEEANSWTGYQRWPASLPVFLAGDLNSTEQEDAYCILNSENSPLQDTRELSNSQYGYEYTWTGFDGKGGKEGLKRIDFIFCGHRKANWWSIDGHSVIGNSFEDGVFVSDHRAVVADLRLH